MASISFLDVAEAESIIEYIIGASWDLELNFN